MIPSDAFPVRAEAVPDDKSGQSFPPVICCQKESAVKHRQRRPALRLGKNIRSEVPGWLEPGRFILAVNHRAAILEWFNSSKLPTGIDKN